MSLLSNMIGTLSPYFNGRVLQIETGCGDLLENLFVTEEKL